MKYKLLAPIKERPDEYEPVEEDIAKIFRDSIYLPMLRAAEMPLDIVANATEKNPLIDAIMTGRIVHYRGHFRGRFNAATTRELRRVGAKWDRRQGSFKISLSDLPPEIAQAIRLSDDRFTRVLKRVDNLLADMLPDSIVEKLSLEKHVDSAIFRMDKDIKNALKGISVPAQLPPARIKTIAKEYNNNMKRAIKEWSVEEIQDLRGRVSKSAFAGNRYEALQSMIQKSYGVSKAKAKFLARQETNLLLASYKKSRMMDAGLPEYMWKCVHASPLHPVRPMHQALDGRIFRYDDPPIVNEKGDRKNPGEDYGCRCFARPVVRF